MLAIEAVVVNGRATAVDYVAGFADIPEDRAEKALRLAADLGLLTHNSGRYAAASPLCRMVVTRNMMQKAAVLRVVLESYEPFVVFRGRLKATDFVSQAAQQTKQALDLDAHRDTIKDTLVNLGTFSHALDTEGGGIYVPAEGPLENSLLAIAQGCKDIAAAEAQVRLRMGDRAADIVSRDEVLLPLANALLQAASGDARGAVVLAGNALESFLEGLAARLRVNVTGAPGVNAKLDRFAAGNILPRKLIAIGKYLGNVRNAADHGIDPDIGAAWIIQESTGLELVYVACSFVCSTTALERGEPLRI